MMSEEKFRWTALITASFIVHAAALSWLDLSGANLGELPARLTVLITSAGEGEAEQRYQAPASASRSRDLFSRPQTRVAEAETETAAKEIAEPAKPVAAPEPVAAARTETLEPAPLEDGFREPAPSVTEGEAATTAEPTTASKESDAGDAARRGELLSLLHEAISREKRYPLLAVRQRREGTTTVSFKLSPDGEMDAVGVDRSSGFSMLDTAAVSAVSRVAPFAPARLFLSDVTRFKVDVTFKLN